MVAPGFGRLALAALLAAGAAGPPVKLKVALPSRAKLSRVPAGLELRWDAKALRPVEVEATPGAVVGARVRLALTGTSEPPASFGSESLSSPPSFNPEDMSLLTAPPGVVPAYLHVRVEVFETDVPAGHHWSPESGHYRVLYASAFAQPVPR